MSSPFVSPIKMALAMAFNQTLLYKLENHGFFANGPPLPKELNLPKHHFPESLMIYILAVGKCC